VPDCSVLLVSRPLRNRWGYTHLKDNACGGGTTVSGPHANAFFKCVGRSAFQSSKALSSRSRSFVWWLNDRDFRRSPYIVFTTWFKIMLSLQSSANVDTL
jgi:hypothetical protein